MLDIFELKPVVDVHDLIKAIGVIDDVDKYKMLEAIRCMCVYGCNESFLQIEKFDILESLYCVIETYEEEHKDESHNMISWKEFENNWKMYLNNMCVNNIPIRWLSDKIRYKLLYMMDSGDVPEVFVVRVWW